MTGIRTATASSNHQCCRECGTELAPQAVMCPACRSLVHAERLRQLAAAAEAASATGDDMSARTAWQEALRLLPADSEQSGVIAAHVRDLTTRIDTNTSTAKRATADAPWWRRGIAGILTAIAVLLGKLKFLLLGLTKLSTFASMFAFFGVYWGLYGWPLALGFALSIYIHEMGHVAMLKRLGIEAGAPMFIPGIGALIRLRQHVDDPVVDAKIGLAGPLWGLGAALAALGVYEISHAQIWMAIAQLTGFMNLFNLLPVWQLDGSRGFHALSREERWVVVVTCLAALWLTDLRFLFIIAAVAAFRALRGESGPGNRRVLATFVVLVGVLSWLARGVG